MSLKFKLPGKGDWRQFTGKAGKPVKGVACLSFAWQQYLLFACALVLPLFLDLFVWKVVVAPLKREFQRLEHVRVLIKQKPVLEVRLNEGREHFNQWLDRGFMLEDGGSLKDIQRIADLEGAVVKQLHVKTAEAEKKNETALSGALFLRPVPVSVTVRGDFPKLARWLGGIEDNPGIQCQAYSLTADEGGGAILKSEMNILVKKT